LEPITAPTPDRAATRPESKHEKAKAEDTSVRKSGQDQPEKVIPFDTDDFSDF
jgi:hypothetical protein